MRFSLVFLFLALNIPAFSQKDDVDDPIQNFDKLWNTFDQRYANFNLKQIDWDNIYTVYRPRINENTSNEELFEVSCSMLQELKDGHVTLEPMFAENENIECGAPYGFHFMSVLDSEMNILAFESIMNQEFQQYGFSEANRVDITEETNFQYRVSDRFGYLRLDEMTEALKLGKINKAFDNALEAFNTKEGVIVDLRFNGGGWDYISYLLAGRFVREESIGHYEKTKIKGKEAYTDLKYREIKPKGSFQFTKKPIVILTSDFTASAAEVFVLMMKDLSYVTLIGDTTEGIFSDMYFFKLPNKWKASLSNQQFFSKSMENFEGIGISPEIEVRNNPTDLEKGTDPVLRTAIEFLQKELVEEM
ncbi:S41 family peptidase [Aureibacter tunicatorum]|uniref:Tail specific protease domain-containing protein n=1 Tax=Aureibacter tunicatorum TaxID=866807 RepID=A0AAE4BP21_9BACT|nr:S41 family peptidase [Aureibacter tunicatorum]MDR6237459.1 hypothetical protein [Aureibacter tunicatorum]BDD06448.1 peptidase S41 [Aureibacter tunicatorum]